VFGCLVWVGHAVFVETTPSSLYKGHRYPVESSVTVWLYHRFPLRMREVEEMMMARGVLVTYESDRGCRFPAPPSSEPCGPLVAALTCGISCCW
jgi:hypothetical protein